MEDYDSEIEMFFLQTNKIASYLSKLKFTDKHWSGNYEKMIQYLYDLTESIVEITGPSSHQFLIDLSLGGEVEDDSLLRLKSTENPLVADLVITSTEVRELIFLFVRNNKISRFTESFSPHRFQGLPFLGLALTYRSMALNRT